MLTLSPILKIRYDLIENTLQQTVIHAVYCLRFTTLLDYYIIAGFTYHG